MLGEVVSLTPHFNQASVIRILIAPIMLITLVRYFDLRSRFIHYPTAILPSPSIIIFHLCAIHFDHINPCYSHLLPCFFFSLFSYLFLSIFPSFSHPIFLFTSLSLSLAISALAHTAITLYSFHITQPLPSIHPSPLQHQAQLAHVVECLRCCTQLSLTRQPVLILLPSLPEVHLGLFVCLCR